MQYTRLKKNNKLDNKSSQKYLIKNFYAVISNNSKGNQLGTQFRLTCRLKIKN